MAIVTDIVKVVKGEEVKGFYMDGYLSYNLSPVPRYLKAAWDCVGIISGHGKVRIGKSTMAAQVGYYIAWLIAGGEMLFESDDKGNPKIVGYKKPKNKVMFNLQENVVFSAEELQERADQLYKKYGKHQVIIYDEGRQGLDSSRAMENINKGMQDFFQECGFMGHVILIVVPNFFKLHEDYAVARSLFLIDVYASEGIQRGYFNFYNEYQKELLFYFGKKRIGVTTKYASANPNFYGRFTQWLPFDKKEYEEKKMESIENKRKRSRDKKITLQRDVLIWLMYKRHNLTYEDIIDGLEEIADIKLTESHLKNIVTFVNSFMMKQKGY